MQQVMAHAGDGSGSRNFFVHAKSDALCSRPRFASNLKRNVEYKQRPSTLVYLLQLRPLPSSATRGGKTNAPSYPAANSSSARPCLINPADSGNTRPWLHKPPLRPGHCQSPAFRSSFRGRASTEHDFRGYERCERRVVDVVPNRTQRSQRRPEGFLSDPANPGRHPSLRKALLINRCVVHDDAAPAAHRSTSHVLSPGVGRIRRKELTVLGFCSRFPSGRWTSHARSRRAT